MTWFTFCIFNFCCLPCIHNTSIFLYTFNSLILTYCMDRTSTVELNGNNQSANYTNMSLGGRCWPDAVVTDHGVMKWGNKPSYICTASGHCALDQSLNDCLGLEWNKSISFHSYPSRVLYRGWIWVHAADGKCFLFHLNTNIAITLEL